MSLSDEKNCNKDTAVQGNVFNIQKFCTNDGPGIRTTVFLKGCPLHCEWCHNPESQKRETQLLFDASKCVNCGRCVQVCPVNAQYFKDTHEIDRSKCVACGECCKVCPTDALELAGKEMSIQEVMEEVLSDKIFYDNSGGGMTLSGGEPLLQFDFAYELLRQAKANGLHTCIETCGFVPTEKIKQAAAYIDMFLFDWKVTDDTLHKRYTGGSNALILQNLRMLDAQGAKIVLRCPIIPDVNDTGEHFKGIAALANSLRNVSAVEIEPYHSLGNSKYQKLDEDTTPTVFRTPADEEVERWIDDIGKLTYLKVQKA